MNYIDTGSVSGQRIHIRKSLKKNSIFFQQVQIIKEEQNYRRNAKEFPIFQDDPDLLTHQEHFILRNEKFFETLEQIIKIESTLLEFSSGYKKFGLKVTDTGITYTEFDLQAQKLSLYGSFNGWNRSEFQADNDSEGIWKVLLPRNMEDGSYLIIKQDVVRVCVIDKFGKEDDKIPIWASEGKLDLNNQIQAQIKLLQYEKIESLVSNPLILSIKEYNYCQLGFNEISQSLLETSEQGYNIIILKQPLQELIFVPNVRQGTSEDLLGLIKEAHHLNLKVLIEVDYTYYNFKNDIYGKDGVWDHSKWETLRILLSNVHYWINEFNMDGLFIRNVSQAIYGQNEQLQKTFNVSIDTLVFYILVNDIAKQLNPYSIIMADESSGYPALDRPIMDGGLGFDYIYKQFFKNSSEEIE